MRLELLISEGAQMYQRQRSIVLVCLTIGLMVFLLAGMSTNARAQESYPELLRLTTRFYGAQRCGADQHNWVLADNPVGTGCHWYDGLAHSTDTDLSGGWHDAGDFLKFTLTNAYSAYTLLKGYDAIPSVYPDQDDPDYSGQSNGIPDILDEVRYATDYLIKARVDENTLVARVGGDQDHDFWVTSPYQTSMPVSEGGGERPVYAAANADICGISTAALALMALKYEPFDAVYAAECLAAAESIYSIGLARPGITADNFYSDNTWRDGMMCGAVELFRVTGEQDYFDAAIAWEVQLGPSYWVLDWASHHDLGRHSLALLGHTAALSNWAIDVDSYFDHLSTATSVNGLIYFSDWGSLRYALNAAFSAALYYSLVGDEDCRDLALSQLEYVAGDNEYNRSFVVGFGVNPPGLPHHKNSYGRQVFDWELDEEPLFPLLGALVGGPTLEATGPSSPGYADEIEDYIGNEVTVDYNAALVGLCAWAISEFGDTAANPASPSISFHLGANYPNPFNPHTRITFSMTRNAQVRLDIFDPAGHRVRTLLSGQNYQAGTHHVDWNGLSDRGQALPSGLYLTRLLVNGQTQSNRMLLLR